MLFFYIGIIICILGIYSISNAQKPLTVAPDVKSVPSNSPGGIPKGKPGRLSPIGKTKLPELVITQISLDNQCRITGILQNRGSAISPGSADLKNLEIRVSYTAKGATRTVTLKTHGAGKSRSPRLLRMPSDRKSFMSGRPVKFSTGIKLQGTEPIRVLAQIDPDNKIKETKAGERKKQIRKTLLPKCGRAESSSPAVRQTAERPDVDIPAPSRFSTGGMVTRNNGSETLLFQSPRQDQSFDPDSDSIPVVFGFQPQAGNYSKIEFELLCFTKEGSLVKTITDPGWEIINPRYSPRISFNMSLQGIPGQDLSSPLYRVNVKCYPEGSKPPVTGRSDAFSIQSIPDTHYIRIERVFIPAESQYLTIRIRNIRDVPVDPMADIALLIPGHDRRHWMFSRILPADDPNLQRSMLFSTRQHLAPGDTFTIEIENGDRFTGVYEGLGNIRELSSLSSGQTANTATMVNPGSILASIDHFEKEDGTVSNRFEVGEKIVIKGSRFGTAPGHVSIRWDTFAHITPVTVESYTDDTIIFMFPLIMHESVGFENGHDLNGTTVRIKILPDGHSAGPQRDVTVVPIASRYRPVVNQYPDTITPGQTYEIRGQYLYMLNGTHPPKIWFLSGGRRVDCQLGREFGRGYMKFTAPVDVYSPDSPVTIYVQNTVGQATTFTTRFVRQEYRTISELQYDKNREPSLLATCDECCKNYEDRERFADFFKGRRLINGWKVIGDPVAVTTYCECARRNNLDPPPRSLCKASIINAPTIRSDNPETRVKIVFKPPKVETQVTLRIVGPEGLPHFADEE